MVNSVQTAIKPRTGNNLHGQLQSGQAVYTAWSSSVQPAIEPYADNKLSIECGHQHSGPAIQWSSSVQLGQSMYKRSHLQNHAPDGSRILKGNVGGGDVRLGRLQWCAGWPGKDLVHETCV